jgi:hypothetical protein
VAFDASKQVGEALGRVRVNRGHPSANYLNEAFEVADARAPELSRRRSGTSRWASQRLGAAASDLGCTADDAATHYVPRAGQKVIAVNISRRVGCDRAI